MNVPVIACPSCGGPAHPVAARRVAEQNVIQRRRRCVTCGEYVTTFEVVGGTPIEWLPVEDEGWPGDPPAPLRSHDYHARG